MEPQGVQLFDASGSLVETEEAAREAMVGAAQAAVAARTSCWELINGAVRFVIELELFPAFFGFFIVGGTIKSGICGAPWRVIGGWVGNNAGAGPLGRSARINAVRQGTGGCANSIVIEGEPLAIIPGFQGTYQFDGHGTTFPHTTIWIKWDACP